MLADDAPAAIMAPCDGAATEPAMPTKQRQIAAIIPITICFMLASSAFVGVLIILPIQIFD
jgi:hypothetical protein